MPDYVSPSYVIGSNLQAVRNAAKDWGWEEVNRVKAIFRTPNFELVHYTNSNMQLGRLPKDTKVFFGPFAVNSTAYQTAADLVYMRKARGIKIVSTNPYKEEEFDTCKPSS
jgi:hypothetical protein